MCQVHEKYTKLYFDGHGWEMQNAPILDTYFNTFKLNVNVVFNY